MTDKEHTRHTGDGVAAEIIGGAMTALSYTNEEILDTLPPDEAKEFIELRNKVLTVGSAEKKEYSIGSDEEISLAAEDDAEYE